MADDASLARLAEAVADGDAVDWERSRSGASDDDLQVVEQLRVLAAISSVHRTTEPSEARVADFQPVRSLAQPSGRQWGPLLILSELGEGSQGRVYRALDQRLQRVVALKVVRHTGNAASAAHLVAEARLLARIRHPNVVTVYGADRIGDEMGLWMELVEGRTLAARVAADGPLGAEEAALVGATLCRALAAVHQAGLLHRDIKAQNVVREAGGRIVLMDFGAGRDLLEPSRGRRVVGTPVYLAPEVLSGSPASVQSDIYSLGVLLFFLTTKRFPVVGANIDELWHRHEQGQAMLLRDVRSDLPEPFVSAVTQALARNPRDRFESAGRFEEALSQRVLSGLFDSTPLSGEPAKAAPSDGRARTRVRFRAAAAALVAAVALAAVWVWQRPTPPGELPSIAVLPLRNLSGDATKEYLADSLTDVLITHLTKIQGVRVLSFPAVASFKGQTKSPVEMGSQLGVRYLLAGAIVLDGAMIRTTVQMVDSQNGNTVWAEEYNRAPTQLLEQQSEIVRTVAARLRVNLPDAVSRRLEYRRALTQDAQDAYLRGVADSNADTLNSTLTAVKHLERAVAIDPAFGDAWATMSLARVRMANQSPGPDRDAQYSRARGEALKAIELDPSLGLAYAALGTVRFYYDWDWEAAEAAFKQSIELAPGDGFAYQRYSMFLAAADRMPEAIAMGQAAQSIEPLVPIRSTNLGTLYYYARQYDEAVLELERALDLAPGYASAHTALCRVYEAKADFDRAINECQAAIDGGSRLVGLLGVARVLARAGRATDSERVMAEVRTLPQGAFISADSLALIKAASGDTAAAFTLLDESVAARTGNLLWIRVDPRFDPLREDPRFAQLVRRVGGVSR